MKVLTALNNKEISTQIMEKLNTNFLDIQYQEALLELLEKNNDIDILIISNILPGELKIEELINIIKFRYPEIEIYIILDRENNILENFMIAKGINNIFYNNKNTIEEIIEKINYKNNLLLEKNKKELNNIIKNNKKKKKIINIIKKIKNKINKKTNKKENLKKQYKNNKKIIAILGASKTGKSIFSILLSLNIKNKKILIINLDFFKNDIKNILGIKNKNNKNIINWKKNIKILNITKKEFDENFYQQENNTKVYLEKLHEQFDNIIIDVGEMEGKENFIKNSSETIILVEGNLLGIKGARDILYKTTNLLKNQKDNIKIVFNKQTKYSISKSVLKIMFSDFKILEFLQQDNFYNFFINLNMKYGNKKINKNYKKIIKKI